MFPRLSETFIRNEILELERQGLDLHIFSMKRPTEAESGLVVGSVRAPVTYLPERVGREPLRVLWAHLYVLFHFPRGYLRMFSHLLRKREGDSLIRNLRRFSKTCCLIRGMKGLRHLHAISPMNQRASRVGRAGFAARLTAYRLMPRIFSWQAGWALPGC